MLKNIILRPIATTMCALVLIILGVVASGLLPISLLPEIDIPQITIKLNVPNVSSRELNNTVIETLRRSLIQTPHLKKIEAIAKDGSASILMQFEYGTDISYTFIDVNERIDKTMSSLPKSIDRPVVVKASATDLPAFFLNISLKDSTDSQTKIIELSEFSSTIVAKRLEQLDEVAFVDISGRQAKQLIIKPDVEKLRSLKINTSRLEQAINESNVNFGNLTIKDGQSQYNVRFNSVLQDQNDIENISLNINGRLYLMSELVTVEQEPQPRTELIRSDGREAISMAIIKQSDARMDDLQEAVSKLNNIMMRDYPDVLFEVTRDQTALLDYSIGNLKDSLILGGLLAALVIFLFMQDFKTPFMVLITIPLSLLLSLLLFWLFGISLNVVSLSGLVLGLGMIVDNSIIVIDNISGRWDRGDSLFDAVTKGTSEVFAPLLSSVMTTCSIFLPLIFLSGIAGEMFYDQAMAVTIGLCSSLVVAMFIIPVYYYLFYKGHTTRVQNKFLIKYGVPEMTEPYEKSLKWCFRHQFIFWSIVFIVTISAFFSINELEKRSLPYVEKDDILLSINWNEPLTIKENDKRINLILKSIKSDVKHYTSMIGRHSYSLSHTDETTMEEAQVYIKATNQQEVEGVIVEVKEFIDTHYPNAIFTSKEAGNLFDAVFSSAKHPLIAHIRSVDGETVRPERLTPLLNSISLEFNIESVAWQEYMSLHLNSTLLSLYNVSRQSVYNELRSAMNQNDILTLNTSAISVPVIIGEDASTLGDIIETQTVLSADSVDVPLSLLITESANRDLSSIISGKEGNYYPLALDISSDQVPNAISTIETIVNDNGDFDVSFSGEWFESRDMIKELMVIFCISLLMLYFILASQFESFVQPFIILSEIVVDISGALLFLWICGESLNLMSMIGLIVMSGIVINDGILKVDTFNRLRKSGMSTLRAIISGGERRLKPIIMTSLTTVIAILPLLFMSGMGADLQRSLSITIMGGMIVGTIFSIYALPLMYYYIYKNRK